MQIQRVTSLLQGIASARSWLRKHIPLTSSMAGYDLFLKIANDTTAGKPLTLPSLLVGLQHPERVVLHQMRKMEAAGLIRSHAGLHAIEPTEKFLQLLKSFSQQFESLFILRKGLRDQQLVIGTEDAALRDFVESLYDHFYDLGWLYLHNFGSACFLMATPASCSAPKGTPSRARSTVMRCASWTSR
ncbi:hypothetical protein [Massilia sp. TWR1-2-2]|uniref:hypothetical protein n=1 Tax=Massilia sp. TWR1-2-2 TaxID=2804584 RepID=UPI003CF5C34B